MPAKPRRDADRAIASTGPVIPGSPLYRLLQVVAESIARRLATEQKQTANEDKDASTRPKRLASDERDVKTK